MSNVTDEVRKSASPDWHAYAEDIDLTEKVADIKAEFSSAIYDAYLAGFRDGLKHASREETDIGRGPGKLGSGDTDAAR